MSQQSAMCPKDLQRAPWWLSWQRARLQCRRPQLNSWVGKTPWRREWLPTPVFLGFPGGSAGKESACNAGDLGLIPGLERSPGEGNSYPLQYPGLENPMDCRVHWVAKSGKWLSDFHFHFQRPSEGSQLAQPWSCHYSRFLASLLLD